MTKSRKTGMLAVIGPGILVAATGVGAGDLATGALTGSKLGVAILWAVLLGAGIKYVLNEGLARWQLATGTTLLEGSVTHLGRPVQWVFLVYLLIWSYFVGSALMSACGITAHAMLPIFDAATHDKILYGIVHSALAAALVKLGGYRVFAKIMSVCIGVMFVVVLATAVAVKPDWAEVATGLVFPTIPTTDPQALAWTVALMGGVGGTLTVLCYGYWIREEGRHGQADLRNCRVDLAVAYGMTALFGIAMVIIGSTITVEKGKSASLIVDLAGQLQARLGTVGTVGKWAFLVGAWGAIFSSMLGVWQSVPYLFADFWGLMRNPRGGGARQVVDTRSLPYRAYLYALATIPAIGLLTSFAQAQKYYAVFGALFIPMLAVALLVMNGRAKWVGDRHANSRVVSCVLVGAVALFALFLWFKIAKLIG